MSKLIRPRSSGQSRQLLYLNRVLTVIAALIAVLVLQRTAGVPGPQPAAAQRDRDRSDGPPLALNAAEQRLQIVRAIDRVHERLVKMEKLLKAGLDVRVLEMPEIEIAEGAIPARR